MHCQRKFYIYFVCILYICRYEHIIFKVIKGAICGRSIDDFKQHIKELKMNKYILMNLL